MTVEALVAKAQALGEGIEGITLSGGEPMAQAESLLALLRELRAESRLSVLLFSGYRLEEISAMPYGPDILALTDILIAGRFLHNQPHGRELLGSANQRIHRLSDRYRLDEVRATPELELHIGPDSTLRLSGVASPGVLAGPEID